MESRKITIKSSKFNGLRTIMSSAETLAELKIDLDNAGISYRNMQFLEGISKTELKDDASILPHDVPYKGRVTNELVFWLTKAEKNIASGAMSRQECYAYLKEHNMGEAIKTKYGRNYTQVPTDELNAFINATEEPKKGKPTAPAKEKPAKAKKGENNTTDENTIKAVSAYVAYVENYEGDVDELIDEDEYKILKQDMYKALNIEANEKEKIEASYDEDEIEDMFDFNN